MKQTKRGEARAFLEEAIKFEGDECLFWNFGQRGKGYGEIWLDGKIRGAHIIVCEAVYGPKPEGYEVAHSCGNRLCVAPRHLRWATRSQNHADKLLHDTHHRGERHPSVKITEEDVFDIRKSKETYRVIAARYGISETQVYNIRNYKKWAWL